MVLCLLTGIQLLVIIDGLVVLPAVQLRLHNLRETRGESVNTIQYQLMTLSSTHTSRETKHSNGYVSRMEKEKTTRLKFIRSSFQQ